MSTGRTNDRLFEGRGRTPRETQREPEREMRRGGSQCVIRRSGWRVRSPTPSTGQPCVCNSPRYRPGGARLLGLAMNEFDDAGCRSPSR